MVVWFSQLKDVARGLTYMHGEGVVHGDLKGVNLLTPTQLHYLLTDLSKGQYPDRSRWPRTSRRLRTHHHHLRLCISYNLDLIRKRWDDKVDESGALESKSVRVEGQSANEGVGLLCVRDGDTRSPQWTGSFQGRLQ